MLTVLIKKDESTSVPRQVADMAAARALMTADMPVYIQNDDGSTTLVEAEDAEAAAEAPAPAPKPAAKKAIPAAPKKSAARK